METALKNLQKLATQMVESDEQNGLTGDRQSPLTHAVATILAAIEEVGKIGGPMIECSDQTMIAVHCIEEVTLIPADEKYSARIRLDLHVEGSPGMGRHARSKLLWHTTLKSAEGEAAMIRDVLRRYRRTIPTF